MRSPTQACHRALQFTHFGSVEESPTVDHFGDGFENLITQRLIASPDIQQWYVLFRGRCVRHRRRRGFLGHPNPHPWFASVSNRIRNSCGFVPGELRTSRYSAHCEWHPTENKKLNPQFFLRSSVNPIDSGTAHPASNSVRASTACGTHRNSCTSRNFHGVRIHLRSNASHSHLFLRSMDRRDVSA
jgi:hypothetical protein